MWWDERTPGGISKLFRFSRLYLLARERSERDTLRSVQSRIADILLASERSEQDTLRSVQLRIADIYIMYIIIRANFVLITRKEGGA